MMTVWKEQNRLAEKLNSFMRELPKIPDELNVKPMDMSQLEIEPDWCKYVGESFAQVSSKSILWFTLVYILLK